ncbi:hypothetical protein N1851_032527 [Merluccius polli]|uniref:Integrase catalytic domain-containing protein n=1 Tax=Merluccius polli TaxID=89951 RepID=A0AA47M2U6_MERPO|nr:hypothetical protein N1851_032527 [Merluccius polli]
MAALLQVSVRTVHRRLRHFPMIRQNHFAIISDVDLDDLVRDVVAGNDQIGPESVRTSLRTRGFRVQRRRVRESMLRTNPGAAAVRALLRRPERRVYQVQGPNSLWHIDGNHKLIRWRIVIHGGIDGFSRLIVFLRASNNNRSSTVLESFVAAIVRHGVPSRIRTDRGGENADICMFMNVFRGARRGSAIQGRSVHNQRIERLWGDMWRGISNVYHRLFYFLESEGVIDVDNEQHLWALHYIYLPRLNRDLADFTNQWNHHGLRTERHRSPMQLFVRGCLHQQGLQSTAMQSVFASPDARLPPPDDPLHPPPAAAGPQPTAAAGPQTPAAAAAVGGLLLDWPERVAVPHDEYTIDDAVMGQIRAQLALEVSME